MDFEGLSRNDKVRLKELLTEKLFREDHTRINQYKPYPWQKDFFRASKDNSQILLMCGNRTGKTFTGAAKMSYHLTGKYPDDWEGRRFNHPVQAWGAGVSNSKTRDVVQKELLGQPDDPDAFGTGSIPLEDIVSVVRLPGVPNAVQSIVVKHYDENGVYDGNSRIGLLSYEMGWEKFQSSAIDIIWLDEEPPYAVFSQCITRTADTGGQVYLTFTPEKGRTALVNMFLNDLKKGQAVISAGWEDCPHLSDDVKEQLLSVYLPHERDMRSKGIPVLGAGQVFPVDADRIKIEAFEIPAHWPRLAAIDFGWDHPTAVVWIAWDKAADVIYIYDCYKLSRTLPAVHASSIRARGMTIPVAWPHDGYTHDKGSGKDIRQCYVDEQVNMLPFHFTNPPLPGAKEGSGGYKVEGGIMEMLTRMETGRLKVFEHLHLWFEEFTQYSRNEDGSICKLNDDIMAASRYAVQSRRFAAAVGMTGYNAFQGEIEYPDLDIV